MDPVANLAEQRKIVDRILNGDKWGSDDAYRLAELVEWLDIWRRKGGFDPYAA